eukprot:TRINITY_DN3214_c0_g1_i1.p1 TRINITY_DN3214_c0_g1~~TRINITY_DN3214_c0_g1_i1.p1  ORF type:complete len:752 (+),score=142.11 TRINITY_DN3214_c0_g1_i1:101-2356(+)
MLRVIRLSVSASQRRWCAIDNVRNIGIIAHIDAGKTTTTERMLRVSNKKTKAGAVDQGTTTTDYMDQERERGITIQSALAHFDWGKDGKIWLIDTPGHADFTSEVEKTLRVTDGAVAVFDGVKGVEAQSKTVLLQTKRYKLPFISYVNKMDRKGADYEKVLSHLEEFVHIPVLPLQLPVFTEGRFFGVVDLIHLNLISWEGESKQTKPLPDDYKKAAHSLRARLLDSLSGVSDVIADTLLDCLDNDDDAGLAIDSSLIEKEVATACKARLATPAICGSSAKGMGVETLLDSVMSYLPSPRERSPLFAAHPSDLEVSSQFTKKDPLAAVIFKVSVSGREASSASRATLVRVYSGELRDGHRLLNSTRDKKQTVKGISIVHGEDFSKSIPSLGPGGIGCVWGLDHSYTGDTLIDSSSTRFELSGIHLPVPVVSSCFEPYSSKEQAKLDQALEVIQLEDPAIHVNINEFGQTVVSGMGSLHLDITKTKIERGWNIEVYPGHVKVKHREWFSSEGEMEHRFLTKEDNEMSAACNIKMRLTPVEPDSNGMVPTQSTVTMSLSEATLDGETLNKVKQKWFSELKRGVTQALGCGVLVYDEVCGVKIDIYDFETLPCASKETVGNAADYTTKLLMQKLRSEARLLEPIMKLEVTIHSTDIDMIASIRHDITSNRRGSVVSQIDGKDDTTLVCSVPSTELETYAPNLMAMSTGSATFVSSFEGFRVVYNDEIVQAAKTDSIGFTDDIGLDDDDDDDDQY